MSWSPTSALSRKGCSLLETGDMVECLLCKGSPSGHSDGATRMCVSFQDQETSFPRALSAQRLSPRWCFLDGECFCISWRGRGWGSSKARHRWMKWPLVFQKVIQKPCLWLQHDWHLHLKQCGLADVATHLPKVIFLQASWCPLAELLSIKLLKLTFPYQCPSPGTFP